MKNFLKIKKVINKKERQKERRKQPNKIINQPMITSANNYTTC